MIAMTESRTLLELTTQIKETIMGGMPLDYWVVAETSDLRTNASGHCYLEFIQYDAERRYALAKIRGVIWASTYIRMKEYFFRETGQQLASGMQVMVRVRVQFHQSYGISLVVNNIDPTYTLGDAARRRKEILKKLTLSGVIDDNKTLELPYILKRIAVISSASAAGYGDFVNQLNTNPMGYAFDITLYQAMMQGGKVEETVTDALEHILDSGIAYDIVVLIRGGGASSDLSDFDNYNLALACAQYPIPIMVGIGHERDETVLDFVAAVRVKTPTAAAAYLIDRMDQASSQLESLADQLRFKSQDTIQLSKQIVQDYSSLIPRLANEKIHMAKQRLQSTNQYLMSQVRKVITQGHERLLREEQHLKYLPERYITNGRITLDSTEQRLGYQAERLLTKYRNHLNMVAQRLDDSSPQRALERGYTLTLQDGKVVKDFNSLPPGTTITTRWLKGERESKLL